MYDLLKGARILDLTTVVLGPVATKYLGDFGADIIKVEPPTGDIFRYVKPARNEDMGAGYLNMNRNKRSVTLDLRESGDRAEFDRLLADADVLVHNMRTSAAERLGLNWDTLRETHPGLVYCGAPGFGHNGRHADKPAYDDIIQGMSGFASLNCTEDKVPRYTRAIVCDKVGGLHLAMAVLGGLVQQAKTGEGCYIEAPMFEGMVSWLMLEHMAGKTFLDDEDREFGYERLMSPNRRPFQTADGYISALPYNTAHWVNFLKLVGRDDIARQSWLSDPATRSQRVDELYQIVAHALTERTTDDWLEVLRENDIPCGPVNSFETLMEDGHIHDVGMFTAMDHPTEGRIRDTRMPFRVEGAQEHEDRPAPRLGTSPRTVTWGD